MCVYGAYHDPIFLWQVSPRCYAYNIIVYNKTAAVVDSSGCCHAAKRDTRARRRPMLRSGVFRYRFDFKLLFHINRAIDNIFFDTIDGRGQSQPVAAKDGGAYDRSTCLLPNNSINIIQVPSTPCQYVLRIPHSSAATAALLPPDKRAVQSTLVRQSTAVPPLRS